MAAAIINSFSNTPSAQTTISHSTDLKTKQPPSKLRNSVVARKLSSITQSRQMNEALVLFRATKKPDTFIWNIMIRGYTDCELFDEAIDFYHQTQAATRISVDFFTFPSVIKSCIALLLLDKELKIHGKLFKNGLDSDVYISNSLIAMYLKMGLIDPAERVFSKMRIKDVTWNSMIDGFVSNGGEGRALSCFKKMQEEFRPDMLTIMSVGSLFFDNVVGNWKRDPLPYIKARDQIRYQSWGLASRYVLQTWENGLRREIVHQNDGDKCCSLECDDIRIFTK